jgi:hypothetical protein
MTDAPDYSKRNPLMVMGEKAAAQVEIDPDKLIAPRLQIYEADGSPHYYEAPTDAEEEALLDVIVEHLHGQDMRRVLRMVQAAEYMIQTAMIRGLAAARMLAILPEHRANYDGDILLEAVDIYLDPERARGPQAKQIDPNNIGEALKTFFPDKDAKPN